ncbi:hypothetical protein Bca52824_022736 [Brassica carinata]|uniref:Uncharacterized protein n=1 Tax=Brassica carinata TaxID=52824 RepID=A0A8X7VH97_BRACI|nr:hypothetical protein Bca52824_022736 [Brassica carinata]
MLQTPQTTRTCYNLAKRPLRTVSKVSLNAKIRTVERFISKPTKHQELNNQENTSTVFTS